MLGCLLHTLYTNDEMDDHIPRIALMDTSNPGDR